MRGSRIKEISEDFSKITGGINTVDPALALKDTQAQSVIDAVIGELGNTRAPGFKGLVSSAYNNRLRGLKLFEKSAGTNTLIALLGQASSYSLNTVNKTTGALADIFDYSGSLSSDAFFTMFGDKLWVASGSTLVKVENDNTAYQVGIAKPSGSTASGVTGGSLTTGTYKIFVSYARKVAGANVLYSEGEQIADVDIELGQHKISFTVPNSTDPQVNNKVVWMQSEADSDYVFWGESGDNTTETFVIQSDAAKNSLIEYIIQAVNNQLPGNFTHIYFYNGYLWGTIGASVYYSMYAALGDPYQLERWPAANFITAPFNILGVFGLNGDLYFNTIGGIYKLKSGDPAGQFLPADLRFYFKTMQTMDEYNSSVIGLTNDGVRFFDGTKFSDYDLSYTIKPEIEKVYTSLTTSFSYYPVGKVIRRNNRTEYHLSFRDLTIDITTNQNNRQLILNLDTVMYANPSSYRFEWEEWSNGFRHIEQSKITNEIFYGQVSEGVAPHFYPGSMILAENSGVYSDINIFISDIFKTTAQTKNLYIKTREIMPEPNAIVTWSFASLVYKSSTAFTVSFYGKNLGQSYTATVASSSIMKGINIPLPRTLRGKILWIEINQNANDTIFNTQSLVVNGVLRESNFS